MCGLFKNEVKSIVSENTRSIGAPIWCRIFKIRSSILNWKGLPPVIYFRRWTAIEWLFQLLMTMLVIITIKKWVFLWIFCIARKSKPLGPYIDIHARKNIYESNMTYRRYRNKLNMDLYWTATSDATTKRPSIILITKRSE